jgi:hypothetical protein
MLYARVSDEAKLNFNSGTQFPLAWVRSKTAIQLSRNRWISHEVVSVTLHPNSDVSFSSLAMMTAEAK